MKMTFSTMAVASLFTAMALVATNTKASARDLTTLDKCLIEAQGVDPNSLKKIENGNVYSIRYQGKALAGDTNFLVRVNNSSGPNGSWIEVVTSEAQSYLFVSEVVTSRASPMYDGKQYVHTQAQVPDVPLIKLEYAATIGE